MLLDHPSHRWPNTIDDLCSLLGTISLLYSWSVSLARSLVVLNSSNLEFVLLTRYYSICVSSYVMIYLFVFNYSSSDDQKSVVVVHEGLQVFFIHRVNIFL